MRDRHLLALGERAAARLNRGSALADAVAAEIDWDMPPAAIATALRPLLENAGTIDVVLADRLVRYFVVTPPEGTASLAELHAVATVRLSELFGIDATAYEIAADWRAAGAFLCCAVPRRMKQALVDAAGSTRVALASIAPLFVRVANSAAAARGHAGWIAVRAAGWVTAVNFENNAVRLVRSGGLDTMRPLEPWLAQLALTCGQTVGTPLVLDADQPHKLPAGWTTLEHDRRDVELLAALGMTEPA